VKSFKKYFTIPASPEIVYLGLTRQEIMRLWTGDEVEMIEEPGTEFSLWDGNITGRNLEFEPGKKIVQQWYFGEQEEPSIVTIKLHAINQGTSVEVRQTNIPDEAYDEIEAGWTEQYMSMLIDFYSEG